uniref:GST C-terminal domain-containing protein n=1 Tax=Oryctolagus cuniculus TaxID=9986 RepID=A0A5F9D6Q0_RABIT
DLNELVLCHPYLPLGEQDVSIVPIKERVRNHVFLTFQSVAQTHKDHLATGHRLNKADILLVGLLYNVEELDSRVIASFFPLSQALKTRIKSLPTVVEFRKPSSDRKPRTDSKLRREEQILFH